VCLRDQANVYNQSLVADQLIQRGQAATTTWLKGMVANVKQPYFSSVTPIARAVGATPVFVDVEEGSYLIDPERIEAAITPATRASWDGRPVGGWGDVGCFSFFPSKNLGAAGDGGAVVCRDPELAQRMRQLAVHGMPRRYLHTELGYNSRLDAIQAAVLSVKLPHLAGWVERRRAIAARYRDGLAGLAGLQLAEAGPEGHSWNQFVVRVLACPGESRACAMDCPAPCTPSADSASYGLPEAACRDWLQERLREAGVNTIIYYPIPIHRQPAYAHLGYGSCSLPVIERLCTEVLSLPIFPELSDSQQDWVIATMRDRLQQLATRPAEVAAA
jgi:dTDP-4-amino-4,6-dideoxygalactose transaminase